MINENGKYEIEIGDFTDKGCGIGRLNGLAVFVEGAVPKDRALVEITKLKKNYAQASLVDIIEKSPLRVDPACEIAGICGGCQIMHVGYESQLDIKSEGVRQTLKRIGGVDESLVNEIIGMKSPYGYRNKAQFPVGVQNGQAVLGFYKKGSHEIVPCSKCRIQHDINEKITAVVKEYVNDNSIEVYDERLHKGNVRHVVTKIGFTTGEIMVVLVTKDAARLKGVEKLVDTLKTEIPGLRTVVQNINPDKTNRILGFKNKTIYGDGIINDYIGDLKFNISPISFFQVNPVQTNVLYGKALEYAQLEGEETVFDIYSGIGTISLFLSQKAKKVIGVEIVEDAVRDASENAKLNGIENVEFYAGKAEEVIPNLYKQGIRADVAVVDPPRKGCDERVLSVLSSMQAKRIVYVSCNPATLARDAKYLEENGYAVEKVQPVDMFPHTMHTEVVCSFKRV